MAATVGSHKKALHATAAGAGEHASTGSETGAARQAHGGQLSVDSERGDDNHVVRLAVVGDVHDAWGPRDAAALTGGVLGRVDMVFFVGDFGNEAVNLVAEVARLDLPKAVILGEKRGPVSQPL